MMKSVDCIVIGSGFGGSVIAREMAERAGLKVLVLEKRGHIGGGAYDLLNEDGILIHQYGPHIFHTNNSRVYEYLKRFTQFRDYSHEVLANVYGKMIPVPFNLNSLHLVFGTEKGKRLEKKLLDSYGAETRVTINELRRHTDDELCELAEYVFNNIFLYYTQKQWGLSPDQIDPSVTARVPVLISRDNRYFQDTYQGIPEKGYTRLFEEMLNHPNIDLRLNTDCASVLRLQEEKIYFEDQPYCGTVVYTGAIDEFFGYRFGRLPYRTLDFVFETHEKTYYQPKATVNYTVNESYTRITEFKQLTGQILNGKTTIVKEFSKEFKGLAGETPYYPIISTENDLLYEKYKSLSNSISKFYLLGRLAEYKYYNMDKVIERALLLSDSIIH